MIFARPPESGPAPGFGEEFLHALGGQACLRAGEAPVEFSLDRHEVQGVIESPVATSRQPVGDPASGGELDGGLCRCRRRSGRVLGDVVEEVDLVDELCRQAVPLDRRDIIGLDAIEK